LRKSFFVGPVNKNCPPKGGDQFKNRILLDILKSINYNLIIIDTATNMGRLKLLILFIYERYGLIENLVISASSVSSYRLIKFLNNKTKKKTTYFVIGGALPNIIKRNNFQASIYRNLKLVVVEGSFLQNKMADFGLSSVVLPNFKRRYFIPLINKKSSQNLNLVFVSRITESKGVLTILEALKKLSINEIRCAFYGPCDTDMKEEISKNIFANYGGYLDFYSNPEESYHKLAEYDAMLFPTKWHGEGFPGVFLDAFMVGLPVICSDWNMNTELIQDGYNGLILTENNANCLAEAIHKIAKDRNFLSELSKNSLASFGKYDFEASKVKIKEILS
jgi:glycosyltransferase involved in cell wall biosynthesis